MRDFIKVWLVLLGLFVFFVWLAVVIWVSALWSTLDEWAQLGSMLAAGIWMVIAATAVSICRDSKNPQDHPGGSSRLTDSEDEP